MVTTGARAGELHAILLRAGWLPTARPPAPRLDHLPSPYAENAVRLYRELGGVQERPLLVPGAWDLAYSCQLVELDESFHFNRYRAATLRMPWMAMLPWSADYIEYCQQWERYAGTGGKRWSNDSAKRMFGGADPEGQFGTHGAPRWKQRALYDFMKDATAASGQVRLARVSIYDKVDGISLNDVLYRKASVAAERIAAFVESRIGDFHASTSSVLPSLRRHDE